MHAFFNAIGYYWSAPAILPLLGNAGFLALYLGGGVVSSFTSMWWNSSVRHLENHYSLGASGKPLLRSETSL